MTEEERAMAWMDEHERYSSGMYPFHVAQSMSSALNIMPKAAEHYVLTWLQREIARDAEPAAWGPGKPRSIGQAANMSGKGR